MGAICLSSDPKSATSWLNHLLQGKQALTAGEAVPCMVNDLSVRNMGFSMPLKAPL